MTITQRFQRGVALLLIPCLLADPRLVLAVTRHDSPCVLTVVRSPGAPPAVFAEQALAGQVVLASHAKGPVSSWLRQTVGQALGIGTHARPLSYDTSGAGSVLVQEWAKQFSFRSWEGRIAIAKWVLFLPAIVAHEILGHIVTALVTVGFRGEFRLNNLWKILTGQPFRLPATRIGSIWTPVWVRWAGLVANVLLAMPIAMHLGADWLGYVGIFTSIPWIHGLMHGWFSIYLAVGNLLFAYREVTKEFDLKKGEIYSSFKFRFDRTFSSLLSERQGQRLLKKGVDRYVDNPEAETVPYVGLIRIDWPFRNIADRRMGKELSDVLRRRIYSFIADKLRKDFPGTEIAATAHPDEILVISSNQLGRPAAFMDELETTIGTLVSHYLNDSYTLVEMPEIADLIHDSRWKTVKRIFASRGIYLSDYAGGSALVIKPYDEKKKQLVDLQTAQLQADEAVRKANAYLNRRVSTVRGSISTVRLAEAEIANPSYPITLSAVSAGIRKCDEMTAWQAISRELSILPERDSRRKAQEWLRDRNKISPDQRKAQCLLNLKQVLISLERHVATRLGAMVIQRAMQVDSPDEDRPLDSPPGGIHVRQGSMDVHGERIDRDASKKEEFIVPLLKEDAVKEVQPKKVIEPEGKEAQKSARLKANIMLEDYRQRLQLAVQSMQRDRREAGEHFHKVLARGQAGEKARITQVIVGGKSPEQAEMYRENYERGLIPKGTERSVIHNPLSPSGMKTYLFKGEKPEGEPADGNGLAMLGAMREVMKTLLDRKSSTLKADHEMHNLYKAMDGEVVMWELNAGLSTRNKIATQGGKINLVMPVVSQVPGPEGRPKAEIVEEELHILAHMMADVFPTWVADLKRFAVLLIYGDNGPTARASTLREALAKNPDISEGFTLLFAPAPASQAHLWGSGDIDDENAILRLLVEKPALSVLSADEQAILKGIASGAKDPKKDPEAMTVLVKLKTELGKIHLLKEDQLSKNTGVGWIGGGTVIRLMQFAGIVIDLDGNFRLERDREVPLQEWDKESLLTDYQDRLIALMEMERKSEIVDGLTVMNKNLESRLAADYPSTDPEARRYVAGLLDELLVACAKLQRPAARLRTAIQQLGSKRTFIEGALRDGIALDAIGDFGSKMAQDADPEECIFGKAVTFLEKWVTEPRSDTAGISMRERLSEVRDQVAQEDMDKCKDAMMSLVDIMQMPLRNPEEVQKVGQALEVDLARLRVELASEDLDPRESKMLETIYHAYAMARWHLEMWNGLHIEGGRAGSGKAFGVSSELSGWLDAGHNGQWHENALRETQRGEVVSAVWNFNATVNTAGAVYHGANAYIDPVTSIVDPYTLALDAVYMPYAPNLGKFVMKRGSSLMGVGFPWGGFTLPENTQVTEGVVKRTDADGSFVIYPMWSRQNTDPDGSDMLFDHHLGQWLPRQLTEDQMKALWPDSRRKITMFQFPPYPGVSLQLIKAWYAGKRGEELRQSAIDELDWDIFVGYTDVFLWLMAPDSVKSPPNVWLRALKAKRIFASGDRAFYADVRGFGELSMARVALVDKEVKTHQAPADFESVRKNGPWLTEGGPRETERRVSVGNSHMWAGRIRRAAWGVTVTAAILAVGWLGGTHIPGILPAASASMGIMAYQGGRFLHRQAAQLGPAQQRARLMKLTGEAVRIENTQEFKDFTAHLQSAYSTRSNPLQFANTGEIQYVPQGNFTQVDALVAYILHQSAPDILDSILTFHEPSHRWFASEALPSILQAWTHPLSRLGMIRSRGLRLLLAPFAPLVLLLFFARRAAVALNFGYLTRGLHNLAAETQVAMAA